jgi:hypothetical protein
MAVSTPFGKRKAVLVSGGIDRWHNYPRYLNDLTVVYCCLVDRYGFAATDVQVVYNNGGYYDMGPGRRILTQTATRTDTMAAIDLALAGLGSNDLFLLFTTNHGQAGQLQLWGNASQALNAADLPGLLTKHGDPYCVGIFTQCYGETLINQFLAGAPPDKGVATSASPGASYALEPDDSYDAFAYHLTTALARQTPSGYDVDSDTNGDGEVHLQEAFDFVMALASYSAFRGRKPSESPYIEDNAGGALRKRLTLNGLL